MPFWRPHTGRHTPYDRPLVTMPEACYHAVREA